MSAVLRSTFHTTDPEQAHAFLSRAYAGGAVRVDRARPHDFSLDHVRQDAGRFRLDVAQTDFDASYDMEPMGRVVVGRVTRGRAMLRSMGQELSMVAGDVFSAGDPQGRASLDVRAARIETLTIDPALVRRVSGPGDAPRRWTRLTPVGGGAVWSGLQAHLARHVLADDQLATPLVLADLGHVLSRLVLTSFPDLAEPFVEVRAAGPASLHRAVAYIESYGGSEISSADIALAARVSTRALQLTFRRHLQTTPTAYLRMVRLQRAHDDLVRGDPARETVAGIAARWGFDHQGRFAAAYRAAYGRAPSTTLSR